MLNEKSIEELIEPILDKQLDFDRFVFTIILNRINRLRKLSKEEIKKIEVYYSYVNDMQAIYDYISELTNIQSKAIRNLIRSIAFEIYLDEEEYFNHTNTDYPKFEQNEGLQAVIENVIANTTQTYQNEMRVKNMGFYISDYKRPKHKTFVRLNQVNNLIDNLISNAVLNDRDAINEVSPLIRDMLESGVRTITTDTDRIRTENLSSAIERDLLNSVRDINQGSQDELGTQFGADGVEISVHEFSAPDHEPVQGHQFTKQEFEKLQNGEDFKDVDDEHFLGFPRAIGEWNCRHYTFAIIVGFNPPTYTKAELEKFKRRNADGYVLSNGKHLTMYECTQYQRQFERNIRKNKIAYLTAKELGNKLLADKYSAKVASLTKSYYAFSKDCGLKVKIFRINV